MKKMAMKLALSVPILFIVLCSPASSQVTPPKPSASSQQVAPVRVPAVVTKAFQAKFPAVKTVEWKLKTDKNYEAEFTVKGTDYAIKFDPAGKWLESEYSIPRSAVPKPVLDVTATKFKGYKIVEIQRLDRLNDSRPVYELHVENTKEIVKIQFGADAAIQSQSSKPQPAKGK